MRHFGGVTNDSAGERQTGEGSSRKEGDALRSAKARWVVLAGHCLQHLWGRQRRPKQRNRSGFSAGHKIPGTVSQGSAAPSTDLKR